MGEVPLARYRSHTGPHPPRQVKIRQQPIERIYTGLYRYSSLRGRSAINSPLSGIHFASRVRLSAAEVHQALTGRGTAFNLANGWRLIRSRQMSVDRIEVVAAVDTDLPALQRLACVTEVVSWRTRVFVPGAGTVGRLLDRYPLDGAAG